MQHQTNNFEETQELGKTFAKQVKAGDILLLFGNLGAGKTTFLQGFAKGLGIERRIISPTFIIVRKYVIASEAKQSHEIATSPAERGPRNDDSSFYHIDLYRTQTEDDLIGLGLPEILQEKSAIVAIEWPEKLGKFIPEKYWSLEFKNSGENGRSITIEKHE